MARPQFADGRDALQEWRVENTIFTHNLHWTECNFQTSAAIIGVQMGEMSKLGYQRHVGGFLVFPVCGVWFNLQDLRFFLIYFVAFFVGMLG
jgi:hypothetical protein